MTAKDSKKSNKRARSGTASFDAHPIVKRNKVVQADPAAHSRGPPALNWNTAHADGLPHAAGAHQGYPIDHSSYQTPVPRHAQAPYAMLGSPEIPLRPKYKGWSSETEITGSALPSEEAADVASKDDTDRSKLKGASWPGMRVFDSATEAQKRKRNQRKDESVLRQMKQTSAEVEPTESVWSENGELQRTRDIYAAPSIDGSPEPSVHAGDNHKKKDAHQGSTMATARQTRASTRKAQAKEASKGMGNSDGGSQKDQGIQNGSRVPAQTNGAGANYDVFRDTAIPSPGPMESPLDGGRSVIVPEPVGLVSDHIDNFEHRSRPALQPMNSNMSIQSPTPTGLKPSAVPYFHGGVSTHIHPFFHHQSIGSNTLNPLSLQSRTGYPFHSFSGQGFGDDILPHGSGFHPINTPGGMAFSPFSASGDNNPYASSSAGPQDTPEYDI
ncbi:hypothetical protein QBC33DRAFT_556366 [Phialemonium atrogriseum]|uniref:Uncharacterized protein n=1 Tax=Phialemonium atrogriseum TaxID=1093897 RepID=A0AAJ0FIU5_9PEZI|nr:uncharacterized protein QBC33DRAFT_556366 [Phialemonium atrogriseum]KAK1769946.1 hypothetical protein QBC33DRAFT_556366 [Phialemonium atrogriseum]